MPSRKKRVSTLVRARQGRGPSTHTQVVEITSGSTIYQQGARSNLQRPTDQGEPEAGGRNLVGRMSQYERRGWGNACLRGLEATAYGVTPQRRKGALGKWRALAQVTIGVGQRSSLGAKLWRCRAGGITMQPRGVCRRVLKPPVVWEGPSGIAAAANGAREIRPYRMRGGPGET